MSRMAHAFSARGSLLSRSRYALRQALGSIGHAPFTHLVASCSLAAALFLAAVSVSVTMGAGALLDSWSRSGELTLYLAPALGDARHDRLMEEVRALVDGEVSFVPAEEALERLALALGEPGEALRELPRNPLPASIEIRPLGLDGAALQRLAASLVRLEGVEEVDRGGEWADRVERITTAAGAAAMILLPLLLLGAAVLAASVVRMAIHERRREIEILRLVGATDAFIRAPFLVEGVLAGLAGGLAAAAGLWILAAQLSAQLVLAFPPELDPAALASPSRLLLVIAAGGALGLVATAVSVERQLR